MKTYIVLAILFFSSTISCTNSSSDDRVKDFIPGIYVSVFEDKISETASTVGSDTLKIKRLSETGSETYEIERRMSYRQTVDGVVRPAEYKTENWKGTYDKDEKLIREIASGKVISFVPEKNILFVNKTEYKKIE